LELRRIAADDPNAISNMYERFGADVKAG